MEVTVYTDGASRGNPGPAAIAFTVRGNGVAPVDFCEAIGTATNNVAEYTAMIRALDEVAKRGARRVVLHSDSELMVRQMKGEYRVKHPDILPLYEDARALANSFESIRFVHVPRSLNAEADRLCNMALDGSPRKPKAAAAPKFHADDVAAPPGVIALLEWARDTWASANAGKLSPTDVWQQLRALLDAEADSNSRPTRRRIRQK